MSRPTVLGQKCTFIISKLFVESGNLSPSFLVVSIRWIYIFQLYLFIKYHFRFHDCSNKMRHYLLLFGFNLEVEVNCNCLLSALVSLCDLCSAKSVVRKDRLHFVGVSLFNVSWLSCQCTKAIYFQWQTIQNTFVLNRLCIRVFLSLPLHFHFLAVHNTLKNTFVFNPIWPSLLIPPSLFLTSKGLMGSGGLAQAGVRCRAPLMRFWTFD